ncbi:hypothetical protein, partial [Nocardioides kribbensis]|uniref:hypothetical protein n=1 Tax=Nocardioides kribbensis TaxID=305517 RepID=UPI0032D9EA96
DLADDGDAASGSTSGAGTAPGPVPGGEDEAVAPKPEPATGPSSRTASTVRATGGERDDLDQALTGARPLGWLFRGH